MTRDQKAYLVTLALLLGTAAFLLLRGRDLICPCGDIRLWVGDVSDPEGSQHLADWYTPSHIIHGFLFFALLSWLAPRLSISWRLAIATAIECLWEIVENSPFVIERYRSATVSETYNGDTVINVVSDVLFMMLGFWLALRLPLWLSVAIVLGFELLTLWLIRDGLALNVLMLLWPVPAIRDWQAQVW